MKRMTTKSGNTTVKKYIIIIIVLFTAVLVGFSSCPESKERKVSYPAYIVFDNTQGLYTAVVYEDHRRREQDKIIEIPAGQIASSIEWIASSSFSFYFEYIIRLKDISGFSFRYIPEIGKDQVAVRIDADTTTTIPIPKLNETLSSPNQLLSNNSYILIQNNSSYSSELQRGNSPINPDNTSSSRVNPGEKVQYTINPEASSGYRLLVGADYVTFPSTLIFEAGYIYSFIFDGGISLITETKAVLENVADTSGNIAVPKTPSVPVVVASDKMIILHWNIVEGADYYEIYLSTTQNPPAVPVRTVPGTAVVLTEITNKTIYYLWIKAVNDRGSSDFSPRARVIPWPDNEVPATPQRPVIIPGVNGLTINWEECGGAEHYEVYINTRTTAPQAPEIITNETSAVISNLGIGTIYYLWVRAANSAGKSNYSVFEIGVPINPTVPPASPDKPVLTAGSREIKVSWQAVGMAAAYEVWLGTSDNSALAEKYGDDITYTETVLTGLNNETVYYVWIKAKNIIGTSGFSLSANATPSAFAALPITPSTPTVIPGSGEISINWPETEGALSYEVWSSIGNNPTSAEKHGADIYGTSVTLTNLINGTTYYIWIRAKNNIGTSGFSPYTSGTPSAFTILPSTPQTAPIVTAGVGQLSVNWQAVEGVLVYEVWTGTTNNPASATQYGADVSDLSIFITGLNNGTTYYVWIKAKNNIGTSGFSPVASGTPQVFAVAPQSPAVPIIVIGNEQIDISWAAVENTAAYEVWLATENNSAYATKYGADISTSLSTIIGGLTNGNTYFIWLIAKNDYGSSGFSPVAIGKPIANVTAPSLTSGNTQITVNWSATAGADQYEIFCGTGVNPPQTPALTINAPATSSVITGLVNGTTYNIWIRGKNSTGTNIMSSPVNAKPIGDMETVTLTAGNQQLSLTWSAVTGADEYDVYYNTSNSLPSTPTQTVSTTSTTIIELTNGTTYYVWVIGKNFSGTSSTSAVVSGKPLGTPEAPVLTPGFRLLAVSWTDVPGADEYEVYYGIGAPTTLAVTTTETSTTITGLTAGTTYQVRIRAKNENGVSEFGESASGIPNDALIPGLYRGEERIGDQSLASALSWISANSIDGDEFFIVLGTNETISPATLGYSSKNVSITLIGSSSERTVTLSSNGSMFTVNAGVTLTLDENITLVGRSANNASLVKVNQSSTLIMNDGAMITRNNLSSYSHNDTYGGGVHIDGGTFSMNGGVISNNIYSYSSYGAGGVYLSNGIFTMNNGEIYDNQSFAFISSGHCYSYGGGVYNNGTFIMNGGKIFGNQSIASSSNGGGHSRGGGVYSNGTFILNNGIISGNNSIGIGSAGIASSSMGGGIYVNNGTFTMSGGIISGNIADHAGGVYLFRNNPPTSFFIKQSNINGQNSGIIYGSDADGIDDNGIPLRNTANVNGHVVVYHDNNAPSGVRNTTAWETDHIDSATGRGTSGNGEPPFR